MLDRPSLVSGISFERIQSRWKEIMSLLYSADNAQKVALLAELEEIRSCCSQLASCPLVSYKEVERELSKHAENGGSLAPAETYHAEGMNAPKAFSRGAYYVYVM